MQGDLALALGMSIAQIKRLSERELNFWYAYRARKMFPARRLEVYLAQLALITARVAGNSKATIDDFLLSEIKKVVKTTTREAALAIGAFAGAGVRKLGQGRKRK